MAPDTRLATMSMSMYVEFRVTTGKAKVVFAEAHGGMTVEAKETITVCASVIFVHAVATGVTAKHIQGTKT
jgi:hypothetical protein